MKGRAPGSAAAKGVPEGSARVGAKSPLKVMKAPHSNSDFAMSDNMVMTSPTQLAEGPFAGTPDFEKKLNALAEVAVRAGLGLAPGQEVVVTAPIEALPLARLITQHAYRAGASLVTVLFSDDAMTALRFRHATDASFDAAPSWLYEGMANAYKNGAARLAIVGSDPSLLSGEDPEKVGRLNRANSEAYRPARELITRHWI